jgi:hypothetical protein
VLGIAPRTASAGASDQIHPAEAPCTKDAPKGPVIMMSPSHLSRNHNRTLDLSLEPSSDELQEAGPTHRESRVREMGKIQ